MYAAFVPSSLDFFLVLRLSQNFLFYCRSLHKTILTCTSSFFQGTVRQLLHEKIRDAYIHPQFITDVIKPLHIESIFDQEVQNLSGGELQRVALTLCLGKVCVLFTGHVKSG